MSDVLRLIVFANRMKNTIRAKSTSPGWSVWCVELHVRAALCLASPICFHPCVVLCWVMGVTGAVAKDAPMHWCVGRLR